MTPARSYLSRLTPPTRETLRFQIWARHRWGNWRKPIRTIVVNGRRRRFAICIQCLCRRYGTHGYLPANRDSDQGFLRLAPQCRWKKPVTPEGNL